MKKNTAEKKDDQQGDALATSTPSYYVAIGASAGGLEAIDTFFTHMPAGSGLSFIVIQHLSPDYKSLMVELLSKKTTMPVHRAEDNMLVEPDHVYLIPPKKNLSIFHGKLFLNEQDHSRGVNLPIDVFFKSLAEDQGDKAIGIILSGTGSDGTRGLRVIKEFAGMVMVQKEDTAKFDGMPRAAISTGLTDYILAPEEMPRQLMSFAKHPYASKAIKTENQINDEEGVTRIFSILREKCKVDFTFYKPSTINRRIERRMAINQTDDLAGYINFLIQTPGEVVALYRELLIGVTSFFRDQEAFDTLLEKWLPEILNATANQDIRLWVAGCSTGEEAYSLAILLNECMENQKKTVNIKIFATDIDRDAIHFAAAGIYPDSIAADVSPRYLAKYFFKRDDSYQITRNIREMVVFAQHNLIKDPPFTNISFLSCRNLLIYFQPILQRKVFEYFNFSLNGGGILFLGTSETTGDMADYFEMVEQKWKIYRSKGRSKPLAEASQLLSVTDTRSRELRSQFSGIRRTIRATEEERILERFIQTVSPEYLPLSVIVNEQLEVLHTMGDPQFYFRLPTGKLVNDISKMAVKELSVPITTGIQKVFRQNQEVRFTNIRFQNANTETLLNLVIKPLIQRKGQERLVAVIIGETKKSDTADPATTFQSYDMGKEAEEHLRDLEQNLQFTRENLQATIEELETSNEELQATNEELLASNEELQSTNEELQSTNEELFTVNAEYQSKIIELTELHNDIENILGASQTGFLLLDENLEVRRFSPNITKIFNLLSNDIGRPITHIPHFLQNFDPVKIIKEVQSSSRAINTEASTSDRRSYLLRIEPYIIGPGAYSGIVVSVMNITELKKSKEELFTSEMRFKNLFETMMIGVVYQDSEGKITSANPAAEKILGLSLEQMQGKKSIDPLWKAIREDGSSFPGEDHPAMVALKTGKIIKNVIMGVNTPGKEATTWINICAIPVFETGSNRPSQVYATFNDISEQENTKTQLRINEEQYQQMFREISNGMALHELIFDTHGQPVNYRFLDVNPAFEIQTGLKGADIIGKTVLDILPGLDPHWIQRYGEVVRTGQSIHFTEYSHELRKEFEIRAFKTAANQFAVIAFDLTNQKNLEELLMKVQEENRLLNLQINSKKQAENESF